MKRLAAGLAIGVLCGVTSLPADDTFPTPTNNDRDTTAQPLDPRQAAETMKLPSGFQASLFAAEPAVRNPIDMAWDAQGRLWIAENYTYSDRSERFDLSLRDRVVVLEDRDGDGQADKPTVFLDNVQMLTSVEVGMGGVWLMCPPQLLFVPDADHDLQPDGNQVQVVLDGFTVAKENYHNFANGLRFGPDGWLYGRCGGSCPGRIGPPGTEPQHRAALEGGMWRYHPGTGAYEVLTHGTTNPWGHDWDEWGEGFFINTVNGHFWHLIAGAHLMRPFTLDPNPHVYEMIDMHADHWHFDTSGAWHQSRDGVANAYGGGHAHCGMMVYLGQQWPEEYRGAVLTLNLHGRRANHEVLRREGSGYVATHGDDFLISNDPFFRGMELSYGPDGTVFVIDWSDTGECHEHTGVHRTSGRVFAVRYGEGSQTTPDQSSNLYALTDVQLANLQREGNEWHARQARLVLAERSLQSELDEQACDALLAMLADDAKPQVALRAMLTLAATEVIDQPTLFTMLESENEHLRTWAIRLLTESWPLDDCYGPLHPNESVAWSARTSWNNAKTIEHLTRMAVEEDSALVRLALASTLQRLPVDRRVEVARGLVSHDEDANDHNLPLLVWYGLMPVADSAPETLAELAHHCRWPTTQRLISRRLAEQIESSPQAVAKVIDALATTRSIDVRRNLLMGMSEGLRGWRRANKPNNWEQAAQVLTEDSECAALVRELNVVFGDGRALDAMREIVLDEQAEIGLRRSSLSTLVDNQSEGLKEICQKLLGDARINVVAAKGLALESDPAVADQLIANYRRFRAPERPKVIAILCGRVAWAERLLSAIEQGKIARDDLTPFDARQLRSLGSEALNQQLAAVWGNLREATADKRLLMDGLRKTLTAEYLASADLHAGRELFTKTCQQCHRLYGEGEAVGPDLTGSNRNNLDYLLDNIVDPSGVVGKDFRMTIVVLDDGRVLNGLVVSRNDRTVTIQTQRERMVIDAESIVESKVTDQSPMPEQILDSMTAEQIRDLFAYLMHPSQVP